MQDKTHKGAVSVLKILFPRLARGMPESVAFFTSFSEKPPSGPIINENVFKNPTQVMANIENVTTIPVEEPKANNYVGGLAEEKYEVKSGDTLDKIALRFYGKYDPNKIEEIQRINNIKNPASLQIGQVIIIPLTSGQ
jgi:nucleoid-associated protein YgaU